MTTQEAYYLLLDVGMDPSLAGFQYWIVALRKGVMNESYFSKNVTTRLYPELANEFDKSTRAIERAMRYAIERLFDIAAPQTLYKYFGNAVNYSTGKLSNKAFLSGIVYYWIYKHKKEEE